MESPRFVTASLLCLFALGLAACSPNPTASPGTAADASIADASVLQPPAQAWRADVYDPSNPVLASAFVSGERIRWYWGGCTTFVAVLEDGATKELLLYDGYVSKDASGLVDFSVSEAGVARVRRYAEFIQDFLARDFKIRGLITSHSHADHVGDIPLLMYFLKQSPKFEAFPVIADYSTKINACKPNNLDKFFDAAELAKIASFSDLVTDLVVYQAGGALPDASVVTDCLGTSLGSAERKAKEAQISPHGKAFSRKYGIYNLATGAYTSTDSLTLGHFGVTAFLMDHAGIPTVPADYRVDAYQVWDTAFPDEDRVLALDTTDQDSFLTDFIETDHLFLTWVPEFFQAYDDYLLAFNRTRTATTVMNSIRFSTGGTRFIVPMHTDDIMALSYTTEDIASAALRSTGGSYRGTTWIGRYEAVYNYSLPTFMMSEARLATRLPENSEYLQSWSTPHVDYLIPASAPWASSPVTYATTKQGDVALAFALFGWRLGD
ncbi:MAG TPA: hypothetical protein VGK67_34970 [Myxococcales bacterium]|jgi:hypothetical protein